LVKKNFHKYLINWYLQNKRDLPWREIRNPYPIWISEIILQQTRVAQGLPYFHRFMEKFPTVQALAQATEQEVLHLWQGLGYYSRARNLHACAKLIVNQYNGKFPESYQALMNLPGIGPYTAAAIASFAFMQAVPTVDGNVLRVLARIYADATDIATQKGVSHFFEIAKGLIPAHQPDSFNQAMMELGATVCMPLQPQCDSCPVASFCLAKSKGIQLELPVKSKRTKVKNRYFHYLALKCDEGLFMKERAKGDIWTGLHDFLLVETQSPQEIPPWETWEALLSTPSQPIAEAYYLHQLSHQRLHAWFYLLELSTTGFPRVAHMYPELQLVPWEKLTQIPKPVLVSKFLNDSIF
jgi:A/G-specific adenine glycosylase